MPPMTQIVCAPAEIVPAPVVLPVAAVAPPGRHTHAAAALANLDLARVDLGAALRRAEELTQALAEAIGSLDRYRHHAGCAVPAGASPTMNRTQKRGAR